MLEPFEEHRWLVWLVASAVLGCAEMLSGDFTLLMLAAGAAAGAVTAAILPGMLIVQVLVAVAVATLLLAVLRPTLLRRVSNSPGYRSSLDKLVGSAGTAVAEITASSGQVKIDGEEWSARALDPTSPIEAGERIEVFEVDGTTLVVYPVLKGLGS